MNNNLMEELKEKYSSRLYKEEIYQRKETVLMENVFRNMISVFKDKYNDSKKINNNSDLFNDIFRKDLLELQKLIKSLFNADITLRFDDTSDARYLSFGMCIYPSISEWTGKIADAIEKEDGFYLRDCEGVIVLIDLGFINLLLNKGMNERHMVAVLLHELGHKVYWKSQINIKKKDMSDYVRLNIFGIYVFLPIWLVIPFIGGIIAKKRHLSCYVNSEALSDLTAVKYGYGKETYELMNAFYELTKKSEGILSYFKNKDNASRMRRDLVLENLHKELLDEKNKKIRKELQALIDELEKRNMYDEDLDLDLLDEDLDLDLLDESFNINDILDEDYEADDLDSLLESHLENFNESKFFERDSFIINNGNSFANFGIDSNISKMVDKDFGKKLNYLSDINNRENLSLFGSGIKPIDLSYMSPNGVERVLESTKDNINKEKGADIYSLVISYDDVLKLFNNKEEDVVKFHNYVLYNTLKNKNATQLLKEYDCRFMFGNCLNTKHSTYGLWLYVKKNNDSWYKNVLMMIMYLYNKKDKTLLPVLFGLGRDNLKWLLG